MNDTTPPTIENLQEEMVQAWYDGMSEERKKQIIIEGIWDEIRSEGIPIKCHGEPMDGRSPYMVHEDDDWLDVLHDSGRYKDGTPTVHRLNIWLDDLTDKWRWALYRFAWRRDKNLDSNDVVAHGDAEPIVDYPGH